MLLAQVSSGHPDLSDWLLLLAVVAFVLALVFNIATRRGAQHVGSWIVDLQLLGLALLACGLFVV